jgi:hypothetical protein
MCFGFSGLLACPSPALVGEDNRGFYLALGDPPVFVEEAVFLFADDDFEAVALIEADGPEGVRPGSDEDGSGGAIEQVGEQARSDAVFLAASANVCMADEGDVLNRLNTHHADEGARLFAGPEDDAVVDLMLQLEAGHVWLFPAISGDDASIGLGGIVDDGPDLLEVGVLAGANHGGHWSLGIWGWGFARHWRIWKSVSRMAGFRVRCRLV